MAHSLLPVRGPEHWRAFHDIRRRELFEARGRPGIYNDNHPDDVADFAHPFVLELDGRIIGALRLDVLRAGRIALRLVAIAADEQAQGHGRAMSGLLETAARSLGGTELVVNAAPEAVGFYEKTGWSRFLWDPAELTGGASTCIQMRKLL